MRKKLFALMMALCLIALAGCGGGATSAGGESSAPSQSAAPSEAPAPTPETPSEEPSAPAAGRTVTDHGGNEIVLPETIDRVVILAPWPLPSVYCLYMGSGEKLVGIHPAVKSAGENSLLLKVAPQIAQAESGFIQGDDINIEELLELKPDVVLYSSSNKVQAEAMAQAGIPAIGFSVSLADWNSVETVNLWLELLEQVFGEEDKAAGITEYGREVETMIADRLKDVAEEDRPTALMLYHYDDTQIQASGKNHFGQYWCDAAGMRSVSEEYIEGMGVDVNMEQIYEWNPDMIFVTNFCPYLPEDFYNNAIDGEDWSTVPAVQNQRVHKFPLGMYRWYPPSSDSPLTLLWLAKTAHPDLFADIDMEQTVGDYYQRFYGMELTDDEITAMFNPPREAALGSY